MLLCSRDGGAPIQAVKVRGKWLETAQGGIEEPHRPAQCAPFGVVICGGELNQALVKLDEIPVGFEPEMLPRLVRFPELGGVEVRDAFAQFIPSIARDHRSIRENRNDRRCASADPSLRSG